MASSKLFVPAGPIAPGRALPPAVFEMAGATNVPVIKKAASPRGWPPEFAGRKDQALVRTPAAGGEAGGAMVERWTWAASTGRRATIARKAARRSMAATV